MGKHLTTFEGSVTDAIRKAITNAIDDAVVQVEGGGGHYTIDVVSAQFDGKSTLDKQRLVYSAIAPLMSGDAAPLHAVDKLTTRLPESS